MSHFSECVEVILQLEGGYSNDPYDPGGETKYGISKAAYPDLDIPNLTKADAILIYKRDYWQRINGDNLPPALALLVFDMAVNAGPKKAAQLLQRMVGATDDGVIGMETLAAVRVPYSAQSLRFYTARRIDYYTRLPGWKAFGMGWTQRTLNAYQRALGIHLRTSLNINLEGF